jgi:hypothetical protein
LAFARPEPAAGWLTEAQESSYPFVVRLPVVAVCAGLGVAGVAALAAVPTTRGASSDFACHASPITHAPPDPSLRSLSRNWLHAGTLWMGYTLADHSFVADPTGQKIAWWRDKGSAFGKLRVSGTRLDAAAPALKTWIPGGYATRVGFQSSALYFPTPGCWRVIAHIGLTQRYQFTLKVVGHP